MYSASQLKIQIKTSEAWLLFKKGKKAEALQRMTQAADMEDHTQKHSLTPGEVIPARELLGDMLLQMNQPEKALQAYEADLKEHYNRFNGLYRAGLAAERFNNFEKANHCYRQLAEITKSANSQRSELKAAKLFLQSSKALTDVRLKNQPQNVY